MLQLDFQNAHLCSSVSQLWRVNGLPHTNKDGSLRYRLGLGDARGLLERKSKPLKGIFRLFRF